MNKQQITINVTKDKKYYLNNGTDPIDSASLEPALKAKITGLEDPTAVLRLDKSLTIQDLVGVLVVGSNLKIKMVLATQPETNK